MKAPFGCLIGIVLPIIGIIGLIILVPEATKNRNSDDLIFFSGTITRYDCYKKKEKLAYCYIWIESKGDTIRFEVSVDGFNKAKFDDDLNTDTNLSVGILRDDFEEVDKTESFHYTPYEIKSGDKFYLTRQEKADSLSLQLTIAICFMIAMVIFGPILIYRSLERGVE